MALTSAERQAAYRRRLKARAGETAEVAVERERQAALNEWIAQTIDDTRIVDQEPDENEMAMLRGFEARPALTGEVFQDWFSGVINREVTDEVDAYRKEWRRAQRPRRRA